MSILDDVMVNAKAAIDDFGKKPQILPTVLFWQ